MTDSRAFGYIFGSPDTGHRFFGIKTDKAASQVNSTTTVQTNLCLFCFQCELRIFLQMNFDIIYSEVKFVLNL